MIAKKIISGVKTKTEKPMSTGRPAPRIQINEWLATVEWIGYENYDLPLRYYANKCKLKQLVHETVKGCWKEHWLWLFVDAGKWHDTNGTRRKGREVRAESVLSKKYRDCWFSNCLVNVQSGKISEQSLKILVDMGRKALTGDSGMRSAGIVDRPLVGNGEWCPE